MSVSGLCQICETKEGRYTCNQCGTFVCEDHYDEATNLCIQCVRAVEGGSTGSGID